MTDNSGNQVLQSGTITWADNSPYIDIDGNGLAVVTNVVTGEGITASLQSSFQTLFLLPVRQVCRQEHHGYVR